MSMSSPSASAKTDPETVVNWPLLVTAAGLGFLLLAVPAVLACIAALKGDAVKDKVAVRVIQMAVRPANVAPVAELAQPVASYVPPKETATPLPVYVEQGRPPVRPAAVRTIAPVVVAPPAPNPVLQFPDVKAPPPFKRLDVLPEDSLIEQLAKQTKEVDLESVKGTRAKLLASVRKDEIVKKRTARESESDKKGPASILALRAERADLRGLPMIGEADCRANPETVTRMQAISKDLRAGLRSSGPRVSAYGDYYHAEALGAYLAEHEHWLRGDGLSTLVQMIQVQEPLLRRELVKRLATVTSAKASTVLARQALFDFSPKVREDAVNALKGRPSEEYRQVLLDGLRYPWPPVAAHAAEALVGLDDQTATFPLVSLLDEPDPCAPRRNKDNKLVVKEVARVNHLRNCLLCHAPSSSRDDPVRGLVPTPGQPLPRVYYSSREGDFVRADVTYLRQDFSLIERVAKPDKWPEWQRFDYMVRTRELTAGELAARPKHPPGFEPASYPQRNAVLFALRELTGLDAGEDSADWYEVLWATTP